MMGWLLMSCLCCATSADEAETFFCPLTEHLEKQDGFWALNNSAVAEVFHRCFDAESTQKDKLLIQFVGDHNDRAYWIGAYLTTPSYLGGRKPRPLLALAIWVNASERLEEADDPNGENLTRKRSLNELAAVQAQLLGCDSLAKTLKARSENARLKGAGGPATSAESQKTYDSIPFAPSEELPEVLR